MIRLLIQAAKDLVAEWTMPRRRERRYKTPRLYLHALPLMPWANPEQQQAASIRFLFSLKFRVWAQGSLDQRLCYHLWDCISIEQDADFWLFYQDEPLASLLSALLTKYPLSE